MHLNDFFNKNNFELESKAFSFSFEIPSIFKHKSGIIDDILEIFESKVNMGSI